jgi:DNA-binding transcriptional LysR family regulator
MSGAARDEGMRLSRFDLNLLVVFEMMMRERSVSRAADKLALSQPATSHALNRLRALIGDPLFVRTPEGMQPTPRAEQLALPVRRALEEFQQALEPDNFSPATSDRAFTLAVNNHAALVMAAPIALACGEEAPGIHLNVRPSGTLVLSELLDSGELDFVIAARALEGARFGSMMLMEDDYVIVMRQDHPAAGKPPSLESFAGLPRMTISSSGDDLGFIDDQLVNQGLARGGALAVPYLSLTEMLTSSDRVVVTRRQIARALARTVPIVTHELPMARRQVGSFLSWHRRFDSQPAHRWMRDLIATTAKTLVG